MSRAMKNSGVAWIGEIPEDWGLETIGKIFHNRNEKVSDYDFEALSVTKIGIVPQLENAAKSDNHNDRKKVCIGDFVINSRSDRKMSAGVSTLEGSVSLINLVLYSDKVLPAYSNYLLKNYAFAEEFYRWGTGIVADLWSTRYEKMKRIAIPYPTRSEQQKIAAFLDEKMSHIDSIILQTKESIEAFKAYKQALITETVTKGLNPDVKMKDSGIECIGGIPEHWAVSKLKRFSRIRYGLGEPPKLSEDGLPIIRATNIERGKIVTNNLIKAKLEDIPSTKDVLLKYGDILIVRSGAYAGDVALVSKEWEGALAGYDMIISLFDINPKFVSYALLSDYILKAQLYLSRMRSAQPHLNAEDVGKVQIVIPSLAEQQQIAAFLDEKTAHIDSLIADKEKMVQELQEYKKSLIYEYVTGKKEV